MKSFNSFVASTLLSISSVSIANSHINEANKLIEVWLTSQMAYDNIPSISGFIVDDQKTLWQGAFGESNRKSALNSTVNTMNSICSTSKVVTATAIMTLVDEGKLNLDDKVKDLLYNFNVTQAFPSDQAITVRSLLTHTSGLPRDTEHAYWSGPDHHFPSQKELLSSLNNMTTVHPVGEKKLYSNVGYAVLGLIIEQLSKTSYQDYVETRLFQPLNMTNSVVEMPKDLYGTTHAIGYTAKKRTGLRQPASFYQTKAMQSAAGISTSIADMAKFARWQLRLSDATQPEILQPKTINQMYGVTNNITSDNKTSGKGLGYDVFTDNNNTWAMHGGICPGYVNYLKLDITNKKAYGIMANANNVKAAVYVNGLINISKLANELKPSKSTPERPLSDYEGYYDLTPWNSEYYVSKWGDGLILLYLPAQSLKYALYQYKHIKDDTFMLVDNGHLQDDTLEFFRDEQGKVFKVKNGGNFHLKIQDRK